MTAAVERDCSTCQFYTRQRQPGARFLAPPSDYCTGLGWWLLTRAAARECRHYFPRSSTTTVPLR